jgi:hypothetical protein
MWPFNELANLEMKKSVAAAERADAERMRLRGTTDNERMLFLRDSLTPYVQDITNPERNRIAALEQSMAALSVNKPPPPLPLSVETFLHRQGIALQDIQATLQNAPVNRVLTEQITALQRIDERLQQVKTQAAMHAHYSQGEKRFLIN